ncbi:MAG: thymidine kinase [Candidatus Colwellbacteria bacterium]|nr:thymidine kinase [Candidatus Colwellbacteria bacterium]
MGKVRHGTIELIVGGMYSGKSEELIRRVERVLIAKRAVQVFKPSIVPGEGEVVAHNGRSAAAIAVTSPEELIQLLKPETATVAIDEIQFFDYRIVNAVRAIAKQGRRVICAGLDLDFRGEPFGSVPELLAVAQEVMKLTAICVVCGEPATMSQRLVDGNPAKWDDPTVVIGAEEKYEARCPECHEIERPVP